MRIFFCWLSILCSYTFSTCTRTKIHLSAFATGNSGRNQLNMLINRRQKKMPRISFVLFLFHPKFQFSLFFGSSLHCIVLFYSSNFNSIKVHAAFLIHFPHLWLCIIIFNRYKCAPIICWPM